MTTKYFKVTASIKKEVAVQVTAENEEVARQKAIEVITKQNPTFNASLKEIYLEYETEYKIGSKVKHFIFGEGEIVDLKPMTNFNNDKCFHAAINFNSGDRKSIHLPMPKEKLEILD